MIQINIEKVDSGMLLTYEDNVEKRYIYKLYDTEKMLLNRDIKTNISRYKSIEFFLLEEFIMRINLDRTEGMVDFKKI
jgi:hypothetical protein